LPEQQQLPLTGQPWPELMARGLWFFALGLGFRLFRFWLLVCGLPKTRRLSTDFHILDPESFRGISVYPWKVFNFGDLWQFWHFGQSSPRSAFIRGKVLLFPDQRLSA
jgi:hypothetical protein